MIYIVSLAEITHAHGPTSTHTHPLNTQQCLLVPKSAGLFPHGASKRQRLRDQRVLRLCSSARLPLNSNANVCQAIRQRRQTGMHVASLYICENLLSRFILRIFFIILSLSPLLCAVCFSLTLFGQCLSFVMARFLFVYTPKYDFFFCFFCVETPQNGLQYLSTMM